MKSAVLLPLVLVAGLAGGFLAGRLSSRHPLAATPTGASAAAATPPAAPAAPAHGAESGSSSSVQAVPSVRATTARGGAAVQALLAGFDRKKPVESNLRLLQKILAATPQELGDLVRGTTGPRRNEPGWAQAKQAAMQRWVEIDPGGALAWAKVAPQQGIELHEAVVVYAVLAEIDPKRALAETKSIALPGLRNQVMQNVLGTIAQTDPQRALRISEDMPGATRGGVLHNIFDAWAGRDPAAAAAGVLQIKEAGQRGNTLYSVMRHFADQDPAGALEWARGLSDPPMRMSAMRQIFNQLGSLNPEQAIAMASDLPKHQQLQMHRELVDNWARTDPEAAQQWILSRPNTIEQQQLILSSIGMMTYMNPDTAAGMFSKLAPGSARDQALQELVRNWDYSDSAAAREFARTLPESDQQRLHAILADSLARRSPEEAIAYLKENPIDDPAHEVWGNLAGAIADNSTPTKALEWARSLEDEATRLQVLPEIFTRLAAQDPAAAAQAALDLPAGSSREESLVRIGGAWAGNDFDDALTWARGLTGKDRESALGAVLTQGAYLQPANAAGQYDSLLAGVPAGEKPADSFVNAAATIASTYFAEDQSKAAAWVAALPQEDARAAATRTLAAQWAQYDAPAASEWIGSLPGGKSRDHAVNSLVDRIAASDPAMAFEWAATVEDASARTASLEATLSSWRRLDADAARAAISASDWPEEEKARWMEKVR